MQRVETCMVNFRSNKEGSVAGEMLESWAHDAGAEPMDHTPSLGLWFPLLCV